jgi:FMNH2-dependent dimethyl sulfone monooxygenase
MIKLGFWCPIHSGEFDVRQAKSGKDETFDYAREVTLLADSYGFEYSLVATRYIGATLEPWTTAAALAPLAKHVRPLVAVHSGLVQPQIIAKQGACLDQISEGRFHINLISGWWEEQHLMYGGTWHPHDERYAVSEEFIQVIKGMWTNDFFTFKGKYYQVENAVLDPKPYQKPYPPTFIGGSSPAARELAAKEGEWPFISAVYPHEVEPIMADIRSRAARYGREREMHFAISAFVLCRDTEEEAQAEAAALRELGERDPLVKIHSDMLNMGLVGTPEQVATRLQAYEAIGVEMALLQFKPILRELDRFGQKVLPILKSADKVALAKP